MHTIDKPIQAICAKMNSMGFQTQFSCAGYAYPGHRIYYEVEKHRFRSLPYVAFLADKTLIDKLMANLTSSCWELNKVSGMFTLTCNRCQKNSWIVLEKALNDIEQ